MPTNKEPPGIANQDMARLLPVSAWETRYNVQSNKPCMSMTQDTLKKVGSRDKTCTVATENYVLVVTSLPSLWWPVRLYEASQDRTWFGSRPSLGKSNLGGRVLLYMFCPPYPRLIITFTRYDTTSTKYQRSAKNTLARSKRFPGCSLALDYLPSRSATPERPPGLQFNAPKTQASSAKRTSPLLPQNS